MGFLKYLWRDAIKRLSTEHKSTAQSRLSDLDITGLDPNISGLRGPTLVQYSGSLVGRDFRIINQVAIFVLYDLLPDEIIETWAALSALVALVWQPEIDNITVYFVSFIFFLITHKAISYLYFRPSFKLLLIGFCNALQDGHHAGSQNPNFTLLCIF